jgi:hypothetical protein
MGATAVLVGTSVVMLVASHAAAATLPPPDACTLLRPADLQAVFGGRAGVGSADRSSDGTETICTWTVTTTSKRGESSVGVQLDVYANRTPADFTRQRRIAQGSTRTVGHVGDTAFSERARVGGQVFDDLWVRTGTTQFRLEVLRDVGPKPLVKLAKTVLANLAGTSTMT